MTFEAAVADGVLQVRRTGTRWLSTGAEGGFERADAAYNVAVPEGWDRTDLGAYLDRRRERAGFDLDGPGLLTGVEMRHAMGARLDPVVAFATVGLSNPAALPMDPDQPVWAGGRRTDDCGDGNGDTVDGDGDGDHLGTVNLVVGTTRTLDDAALANLLAVVAEAKAATLLALADVPGTTTDAVVVGSAADGSPEPFSGSATAVGSAARACVRDAVRAGFRARYADRDGPDGVADADHGVVTDRRAEVFRP